MQRIHDIHPHVISNDDTRYPLDPLGGTQSDWSKAHKVTYDHMLEEMDAAGIASSALVQSSTCYGYDNSYVTDAVRAHPDRFTAVGSIDVTAPNAVTVLRGLIEKGLSGIRIYTGGSKLDFDYAILEDPRSLAIWDFCGEAELPICLQVRMPAFPLVTNLAQRFPKTRLVLDHLARADTTDGPPYANAASLFALADLPNLYLKVTPRTFALASSGLATPETFFPLLVSEFGADRIAFGSNYPSNKGPLKDIVATARQSLASLSTEDCDMILGGTAEILYPALKQRRASIELEP